ncbi:alpha/beta fold hydrolase [Myceligenerans pegani]|uniref:Alpha/beta fold hydrolase n=1 Tax=Myceligenerans pegani TaxID=2776917 RepID=A0ABR9N261_9MICO|nr:alpha/beta fold hydrolase [Myceligenerans sp. TRM 65318]MBE1877739.1 alpha/beta fold hydrolase [Myceligenerans sp. TRM 65318]MBE3020010.1 alpha/beta fold hydrolase [Myceligenerans sp. TRM 65318]
MPEKKTLTLDAPGAVLAYDVHEPTSPSDARTLVVIGLPMGAHGFGSLVSHLTDRRVVTYDPRGVERSTREPGSGTLLADHVDDVRRVIEAVGDAPVDLMGSSGGAVVALELAVRRPELLRTVVAHEPPLPVLLPDRDAVVAAMQDVYETYREQGSGRAMAKFIALVMESGELGPDYLGRPAPDPAAFGLPAEDDGARDDVMLGSSMHWLPRHEPDWDALTRPEPRVVVGVGAETGEEITGRTSRSIAERLGRPPVVFPGGHGGFGGGEYGQLAGDPEGFATTLREVIDV